VVDKIYLKMLVGKKGKRMHTLYDMTYWLMSLNKDMVSFLIRIKDFSMYQLRSSSDCS